MEAGHQTGRCKLTDDAGNTYREVVTELEIGVRCEIDGQISPGTGRAVGPGADGADVLVFHRPGPGVKHLMLELDAGAYGGSGKVRVRIPKSW